MFVVIVGSLSPVALARPNSEARIGVIIEVPAMQRLVVREPAAIVYDLSKLESIESLLFHGVGDIAIQSNANWALTVHADTSSDIDVSIRPGGDSDASWSPVDLNRGATYSGPNGDHNLSWDIMIDTDQTTKSEQSQSNVYVKLVFTLTHV